MPLPHDPTTPYPIMGFGSIPEELTRPEVFETIASAGINVFMTHGDPAVIQRQLALAEKAGIRAIVCDSRLNPLPCAPTAAALKSILAEYRCSPAVFGFYIMDEPQVPHFEEVERVLRLVREEAPEKVAYVNAFGFGRRGADSFFEYVEEYAKVLRPQFLSFDHYPVTRVPPEASWAKFYPADRGYEVPELGAYYRDGYGEAWETFWQVGWKYDLPLWGFVLATPHQHSIWFYGPVTEGTMRFEAFTGLAHGAQATQYFALPTEHRPGWQSGILDPDGGPSPRHDYCRRINRELAILGKVVRTLKSTGVYYTGEVTSGCRRFGSVFRPNGTLSSHYPVVGFEGDPVLAGFFKGRNSERALMVVNRHPARSARLRIELESGWGADEVLKTNGALFPMKRTPLEIELEPGDGRLFLLRNSAAGE